MQFSKQAIVFSDVRDHDEGCVNKFSRRYVMLIYTALHTILLFLCTVLPSSLSQTKLNDWWRKAIL